MSKIMRKKKSNNNPIKDFFICILIGSYLLLGVILGVFIPNKKNKKSKNPNKNKVFSGVNTKIKNNSFSEDSRKIKLANAVP